MSVWGMQFMSEHEEEAGVKNQQVTIVSLAPIQ